MDTVLRIGNASGFYGDRFAAFREMLEGGDLDVLTGDHLAEPTMLILGRQRLQHPDRGCAGTFLRQMEECLGIALERGVTKVCCNTLRGYRKSLVFVICGPDIDAKAALVREQMEASFAESPGVASSTRFDPQAEALGEWLRSRTIDIPEELL